MYRLYFVLLTCCILTACGGGTTNNDASWSALRIFSDGDGVSRGKDNFGRELVSIGPDVVASVIYANSNGSTGGSIDVLGFPIVSQQDGYNIRTGVYLSDGVGQNVLIIEKIGTEKAAISYASNNSFDALASFSNSLESIPNGNFIYSGIFTSGSRDSEYGEYGDFELSANFTNKTFTIDAETNSTSLTGGGFIDSKTGRLSSGQLSFVSPNGTNYSATTYGNLGEGNAKEVSGVFHTNGANPAYVGAYAGSR